MPAHRTKRNHRSAVIWAAARVFASWRSDPDSSDRDLTVVFSPNQHKVYFCLRRVAQGSSPASKKTGLRWGRVWRLFMHLLEHLITTSASSLSSFPDTHFAIAQPLHCGRIMNIWMYSWNCFKKTTNDCYHLSSLISREARTLTAMQAKITVDLICRD